MVKCVVGGWVWGCLLSITVAQVLRRSAYLVTTGVPSELAYLVVTLHKQITSQLTRALEPTLSW